MERTGIFWEQKKKTEISVENVVSSKNASQFHKITTFIELFMKTGKMYQI